MRARQAFPLDVPWQDLDARAAELGHSMATRSFRGVRGFFEHLERKKYKLHVRVFLSRYRGYAVCPDCSGLRLRAEARQVKIGGKDICQVSALTVERGHALLRRAATDARKRRDRRQAAGGDSRPVALSRTMSGWSTSRSTGWLPRLSGGEAQRIQLATSLGSRLVGTLYVLDEPSIGLHTRDTERLIHILHDLRDLGNTILVVEHDPEIMRSADHLLDLGPGAGENGGRLIADGHLRRNRAQSRIAHRPLPCRRAAHSAACTPVARDAAGKSSSSARGRTT